MPSFALEHAQGSGRPEQCSNGRDMLTIHRYEQSIHSIFLFDTGCPQGDVCRISGALSGLPAAILVHGSCHRTYYGAPGPLDAVHRTRDGHRTCLRHPYGGSVGGPSAAKRVWWAPSGTSRSPHGLFRAPLCDPTVRMDGRCSCGAA